MTAMSTRLGVIYASRWSRVACAAPHSPPPPPRAWTDNATQDDYWGSFSSMHGVAWRSETRLGTPRCCPSAHIGSAATLPPPQKQISGGAEMDTYARSLFARSRYACWGRVQKKSLPPLCTRLPSHPAPAAHHERTNHCLGGSKKSMKDWLIMHRHDSSLHNGGERATSLAFCRDTITRIADKGHLQRAHIETLLSERVRKLKFFIWLWSLFELLKPEHYLLDFCLTSLSHYFSADFSGLTSAEK